MIKSTKILFVINVPGRELKTIERIVLALKEIDQNIQTDVVDSRSPTFLTDVLEADPDILMTYPFTSIGLSTRFYIIKFLLNCFVITFPAEGLIISTSPSDISRLVGFDRYGGDLVDHAIFWGTRTAKVIGNELLNAGKISSLKRIHVFGTPFFEAYFESKKEVQLALSPGLIAKISRYSRKNICLFLTGFSLADYSDKDLIIAGDLIDTFDQEKAKKHFGEIFLCRKHVKFLRSSWIEAIKSCAEIYHDFLFVVKMHPHEMIVHKNKNINPYKVLEGYENIIFIEGDIHFSKIIHHCGLLFHYGSTAMLEAYLSEVPTVFLYLDEFRNKEQKNAYELEKLSTVLADIKDLPLILAQHYNNPIQFQKNIKVEKYLKDSINLLTGKNYRPSKKIAQFLLSLMGSKPQMILSDSTYFKRALKIIGKEKATEIVKWGMEKIKRQEVDSRFCKLIDKVLTLSELGQFKVDDIRFLKSLCGLMEELKARKICSQKAEFSNLFKIQESINKFQKASTIEFNKKIKNKIDSSEKFTHLLPNIFAVETFLGCDLKCPECAIGGNFITRKKGSMTFKKFEIIAEKIRPLCKYLYLHLWGEPLLNKEIFEMIKYSSSFTKTNISTNANSLTEDKAEELILSGVTDIIVSIDGVTQEVYEKYRVGGNVRKAIKTLTILRDLNFKYGKKTNIIPQFIVMEHNQHEMNDFKELCESLQLVPVFKSPYIRNHRSKFSVSDNPQFIRPHCKDIESLRDEMKKCQSVKNVFNILLDGSVVGCCHDYEKFTFFGNIFEQDVIPIWNSEEFRKFRLNVLSGNTPQFCIERCMSFYLANDKVDKSIIKQSGAKIVPANPNIQN